MKHSILQIGKSVLGQTIDCWEFNQEKSIERVLIVGGVHGDEVEGIQIANALIKILILETGPHSYAILPCLNKDGETLSLRSNSNDVDLNRNLPTKNWIPSFTNPRYKPGLSAASEPETVAFLHLLNSFLPTIIISLHSFSDSLILYNPGDGKFDDSVHLLSERLNLKLVDKMPYEVVGSLHTYSKENAITTLTIEAPRDRSWLLKKDLFIHSLTQFITGV
jgi:protein MpaA